MRTDFSFGAMIGILAGLAIALLIAAATNISLLKNFCSWLEDWQTLVTGGLAILAAYITIQPARTQLNHMALQSSVMARDALAERLQETEKRKAYLLSETEKILTEWRRILPHDEDEEPDITPEWAHHAEQITYGLRRIVREDHARLHDPEDLNDMKSRLVDRLSALATCLSAIHAPESQHVDDPELGLTEQQIAEWMANAEAEAAAAETQAFARFAEIQGSRDELRAGFTRRVVSLRKRLRAIDDLIDERAFAEG